jgi:DNA polymerase V
MRGQQLVANALNLFIETNRFREKTLYTNSATIKLQPTDSTRELITYAIQVLQRIYKSGHGYRKSGVVLLGLQPVEGETPRLFGEQQYQEDRTLMRTIDIVNAKYGRNTVRFGLAGLKSNSMAYESKSSVEAYTTSADQFLRVIA